SSSGIRLEATQYRLATSISRATGRRCSARIPTTFSSSSATIASDVEHIVQVLTWPNIHLYINHFPVILSVLGLGAAIAALIFRRRGLWLYAIGKFRFARGWGLSG